MLTIQNQPELFWVRALLYWSCAHLLASKLFMKQILKRRLSARPHLICPESRIDAQASSLSLFLSLSPSLSLCSLKIQRSFFLPVSPQLQTQSDMDRNAKTDLKRHIFFPPLLCCRWYIACASSAFADWRKAFLNCSDKGNLLILETYQVCFTLLCSATLYPYKHITHRGSNGTVVIPKDEASYASRETNVLDTFSDIFLLELKCCQVDAHGTLNSPPRRAVTLFAMLWAPAVLLQ